MKPTLLGFLLFIIAMAANADDKKSDWESLPPGPRLHEPGPSEDFYGRLSGKRVTLDALVWYDQTGISGRVVLPSGTSVYIKDPYVERPGGQFPKIEPRLPIGRLVRLVGILTIEHYEPPKPFPKNGQGYSWAFTYLSLKLESFSVIEQATKEEPELSPK